MVAEINVLLCFFVVIALLFKDLIIFRERGREGEREGNIDVREKHGSVAPPMPPAGALASSPGVHPHPESPRKLSVH